MRYLFINSVAGFGSTGRIVVRQCRELMADGHECMIAYSREAKNCEGISLYHIGNPLDVRLHALNARITDTSGFHSKRATAALIHKISEYAPDVIWLHNLHGYYLDVEMLFSFLKTFGKEIHWTLHDCWAFTGHCAYFDYVKCEKWKTQCSHCPQMNTYPASIFLDNSEGNFQKKKRAFTGVPGLTIRVPSFWLKQRVDESFLGGYPVEVVPNEVDCTIFKPTYGKFRERCHLEEKKIILGVANVWEPRKGLQTFVELSNLLDDSCQIVLIGLTEKQIKSLPEKILGLPRTASAVELAEAYTAADVYVCPSVEETFGMTVLEAACCGTPVIVYRGTACAEVAEQFGGIVVNAGAENIYNAIRNDLE